MDVTLVFVGVPRYADDSSCFLQTHMHTHWEDGNKTILSCTVCTVSFMTFEC